MYQTGDVLMNRYVVLGVLGRGGSGCVYLAQDLGVEKYWAVKELEINSRWSRRFAESEIRMLKAIDHHCFPRITDAWQSDNHFYIVSDYIEGISLGQLLNDGPISKIKAYKFAYQIADAIEFLHLNNPPILYLDLKPDNIMLKPDGRIYLIDFGIASFLTENGTGFGTKGFAAPEQYKITKIPELDERTDIYAFGKTYLAMRTGQCSNAALCTTSLCKSEKQFISKCTHQDPNLRIGSMHQVKKYLDHINFFSSGHKFRQVILILGLFVTMCFCIFFLSGREDYTRQMLNECSRYKCDGYYTEEGLSIIENYINSGLLNEEEDAYYSFLVGRTYFERVGDYRDAERYFNRLPDSKYPEKNYYLQMCSLENGFDYDIEKINKSLMEFKEALMKKNESKIKYENLLFVAFCFENYCTAQNGSANALQIYEYIIANLEHVDNDWADEIVTIVNNRRILADGI